MLPFSSRTMAGQAACSRTKSVSRLILQSEVYLCLAASTKQNWRARVKCARPALTLAFGGRTPDVQCDVQFIHNMRLQSMHIGMKVHHPDHGVGTVKSISEHLADIRFDSGLQTIAPEHSDLQPAEAQADLSGLTQPLSTLIAETVSVMVRELGLERDDTIVARLAARWQGGSLLLRPTDASLQ